MNSDDLLSTAEVWTRRRLMQLGAAGAMSLGAPRLAQAAETAVHRGMMNVAFEKREPRVALIGTGGRGTSLLGDLLAAGAQIAALCDIVPEKAEHAASLVVAAGLKKPALPHSNDEDLKKSLRLNIMDPSFPNGTSLPFVPLDDPPAS